MALAEEERCATCGSGDPRQRTWQGEECGDPYHASAWDDDEQAEALPRPSAATIIAMAAELPPRTFRVWLDAHDG